MLSLRYIMAAGVVLLGAGGLPAQEGKVPATIVATTAPQYWFGVAVQNLPPAISKQLKLRPDQGLMVLAVLPDSPAEKAALRAEDVLIEIDGVALTSYEELARAANRRPTRTLADDVPLDTKLGWLPGSCRLTILRAGERQTLTIVPAARPENMQALGANLANFTLNAGRPQSAGARGQVGAGAANQSKMIVLSNGTTAQVGPGYVIDLNGQEASTLSIRRMVERGETVTFTQEMDPGGATRHRLTVGNKSYLVDAARIDSLPEEIRPVARQMLTTMSPRIENATPSSGQPEVTTTRPAAQPVVQPVEKRLQELEKQNQALLQENQETRRRLERVIELLEDRAGK